MPGYNAQQLAYKVLNANSVSIVLGDQVVGFAQSATPQIDMGTEPYFGVGTAKPQEIQQLRFTQSVTIDKFKLTAEGEQFFGINTPLETILANNAFDFYLMDNQGVAFLAYVGCVAANLGTNVSANTPISESVSFMAMDVLDSDGNSVLNGPNALSANFVAGAAAGGSLPTAP